MIENILHVGWNQILSAILVLVAIGCFVEYSAKLWKRQAFTAIGRLGLAFIAIASAVSIAYPSVLSGTGLANLATAGLIVLGAVMLAISGIPHLFAFLPFVRGKHSSAQITPLEYDH